MPTIKLTNNATLDISASAENQSATLNRYLQDALTFRTSAKFDLSPQSLLQSITGSFPASFNATGNGSFVLGATKLGLQPSEVATLNLLKGDGKSDFLNSLKLPADFAPADLVSFAIKGAVTVKDSGSVSDFCFGVNAGETVTMTSYYATAAAETAMHALRGVLTVLTIPHDLVDLESLPPGAACRLAAQSSLKFSASVSWNLLNSALASVAISSLPDITIQAKAGVTVEGSASHTAGHTITMAKSSGGILHLSVSVADSEDLETSLTVSAGLTADLGTTDALGFVLDKIGLDTAEEMKQIRQELPAEAQTLSAEIKGAIDGALSNCLQVSLTAALDRSSSRNGLFLYRIDLQGLDETSRPALQAALRGDFSAMTKQGATLAGIEVLSSTVSEALKDTHSLGIHLLGIFNFSATNQFLRSAKVNLTTGKRDIVLSDKTIEVATNSLTDEKLRELVLKGVTLTLPAAAAGPADGGSLNLVFFDHEGAASPSKLRQFINVLQTVSPVEASAAGALLQSGKRSVCSLYLGLDIASDQCRQLFLADNKAHDQMFYIVQLCRAQAAILASDEDSALRLKLFTNTDLGFWRRLIDEGSAPNIVLALQDAGFGSNSEFLVADVITAVWWSQAMNVYAAALRDGKPLEKAGKGVVKAGDLGFNEPWLILAFRSMLGNPAPEALFTAPGLAKVLTA